jgi:ParB-like nuclease domain
MLPIGLHDLDAERAFARIQRRRRRAALTRRLRGESVRRGLTVYDGNALAGASRRARRGRTEIPLCAIRGTLEPSRARSFDAAFRPEPVAGRRWRRLWVAEERGAVLPPISVVPVPDGYAVRDGHHRVSVALARGASEIDAVVDQAA